jgi:SAM-dependent methyltransferase
MSDAPLPGESGFQLKPGAPANYEFAVAPLMAPFIASLIAAVVRPGQSLLDVACGTGFASRAAAGVIGPAGSLAAIDINPAMVEFARTRWPGELPEVDWHVASALELPFEDASFDAVVCQQGVQFFPDPMAGLREMRRVTRPGGLVGITVWAPVAQSPYLDAQRSLMEGSIGLKPGVFAQACPPSGVDGLRAAALEAGWENVIVELVEPTVVFPGFTEYIPAHLGALPWSAPFFELDPAVQAAERAKMRASLADYIDADDVARVPTASLLLTATAPASPSDHQTVE